MKFERLNHFCPYTNDFCRVFFKLAIGYNAFKRGVIWLGIMQHHHHLNESTTRNEFLTKHFGIVMDQALPTK
jgi:hypothetical protein